MVAGIRGSNSKLEKVFDALLEKGRAEYQTEIGK